MNQIVKLPENAKDITLYQYQRLVELLARTDLDTHNFENRKLHLFTGLKISEIDLISQMDREEMLNQIEIALNEPYAFQQRFFIGDIEFGFIPNFDKDKLSFKEYTNLTLYGEKVETLNNLMAILFRPIKSKDALGNYSIEPYEGTEQWAEVMKLTPMNVVNGALFFFANLSNELLSYIQRFTEAERAKGNQELNTLKNGDGMQLSTD